jgi:hypothetical protein
VRSHSIQRRLAALFSPDVKGYSRLMGDDEVETVRTLIASREVMPARILLPNRCGCTVCGTRRRYIPLPGSSSRQRAATEQTMESGGRGDGGGIPRFLLSAGRRHFPTKNGPSLSVNLRPSGRQDCSNPYLRRQGVDYTNMALCPP